MAEEQIDNSFYRSLESNDGEMSFQNILNFIWRLKWWIILCVAVALSIAFVHIKLQTPMYYCETLVKLLEDGNDNPELSVLKEVTGNREYKRIDDEILILQSPTLMTEVVKGLNLNTRYYQFKLPLFHSSFPLFRSLLNVKEAEFYQDSPFALDVIFDELYSSDARPGYVSVEFVTESEGKYKIKSLAVGGGIGSETDKIHSFGDTLSFSGLSFCLRANEGHYMIEGDTYKAVYTTPESVAEGFAGRVNVSIKAGMNMSTTHLMTISMVDSKPKRSADILNLLVSEYNRQAREFKSHATLRSLEFIDERLMSISQELGAVEANYRDYQASHNYIMGSEISSESVSQFETNLAELRMQRTFIGMVKEEMSKLGPEDYEVIPANLGLSDGGVNQALSSYNDLITERNRLLANSSESNPSVINYNSQIEQARQNIVTAIENIEKVYAIRENELNAMQQIVLNERMAMPTRRFDLNRIARKQQIIEPLFLSLNQKKEELQLSLFSITDNVRVVNPAKPSYSPISPDTKHIYMIALILGFCLPIVVMIGRKLLRTKVEGKDDVKKYVDRPILAVIPKDPDGQILSNSVSRSQKAEAFRMLRSSLQFLRGQVIQVTSSISGEGKSFVAANLAVALSHIGKKVCILGLDLRKPSLKKIFVEGREDGVHSIVGYLIGKTDDPSSIVTKYEHGGWITDVLFAGPIPPNPSELLSMDRMEALMEWCKKNYDYVVIDSAPFFPVPDSAIVNRFVDLTLYVIRSDYTQVRMLRDISSTVDSGRLNNPNIVLNGVDTEAVKYRYGYGYEYGYGMKGSKVGYGYGYGYNSPEKKDGDLKDSVSSTVKRFADSSASSVKKAVDNVKKSLNDKSKKK